MYVRCSAVEYRQLQPPDEHYDPQLEPQLRQVQLASPGDGQSPAQQTSSHWPPVVPGWVFFPSCRSRGYVLDEPDKMLRVFGSLQELLQAALNRPAVVAVTTQGKAGWLPLLEAQVCRDRAAQ
jgi:hypothetical protein